MRQMALVTDILKAVGKQKKLVKPRIINTIIDCANLIIHEIERPDVPAVPGMGLRAWLKSDDTGLSSLYMACMLANGPKVKRAYPLDVDDFGRCYRFLRSVEEPERRPLADMSGLSLEWDALVANWLTLEVLFEQPGSNGVTELIQKILKSVKKP